MTTSPRTRPARAVLLNAAALDFDGRLSFGPIERAADALIRHETSEPSQIVERARSCNVLISKELKLSAEIIDALPPEVRLICEAGTGYDNIKAGEAQRAPKIQVCNAPGYAGASVAELTIGFLLALSTGLHHLVRSVERGDRRDFTTALRRSPFELQGKTLGVIGVGDIGRRVVRRARSLSMAVLGHSATRHAGRHDGVDFVTLDELLERSDFVTLHCPSTDDTQGMMGSEQLSRMKRSSYLINTARGDLVDEAALVEALESGTIAGAALDVQKPEPPDPQSPLWRAPGLILTPHIGWKAIEARRRLVEIVADNIDAFSRGVERNLVYE